MSIIGVGDLPESPQDMPSDSQLKAFGLDRDGAGSLAAAASLTEISQAVADAECRESSGFDEALYSAEWKAQADIIAENTDEIMRGREIISKFDRGARKVIARNAATA